MHTPTAVREFVHHLPSGIQLACRGTGDAAASRRAVFLHGFPEGAFVWDGLMSALAGQACCVAPYLRGYAPSSAPADTDAYRAKHLVEDVLALIDQLTGGPDVPLDLLVAHDWGGGVAWNLAALAPHRIRHLVIINSPHPGALLRELRDSPAQQAASTYMNDLVQPDAAHGLAADDFAALWALLGRFGQATWLTTALRQRYRQLWGAGLEGALNYYRASPLRPPVDAQDKRLHDLQLPASVVQVKVPTTVLWGEQDHALRPGLLDGLADWVPHLTVHRHAQASHWVVHEQPAWVLHHLQAVLQAL